MELHSDQLLLLHVFYIALIIEVDVSVDRLRAEVLVLLQRRVRALEVGLEIGAVAEG